MLEHPKHRMRQSEPKQEPRHANPSRPSPPSREPHPAAGRATIDHGPTPGGGDLACAPNRGTTSHPAAHPRARDATTPRTTPRTTEPGKVWLTLADVADELDVSTRTVMRWVERGQFPAVMLPGGRKRIHRDEFQTWLEHLPLAGRGV